MPKVSFLCCQIQPEYLNLFKILPVSIQISFSTLDDKLAKSIEQNAPSPTQRLKILKELNKYNLWTVARIQPFLYPIESVNENILSKFSDVGVNHIVLEHLRIPTNSKLKYRNKLWKALNVNMLEEYEKIGLKHSRINYELSSEIKFYNVLLGKKISNKLGMLFGLGDNDFHHFSDNLCCCVEFQIKGSF